MAFPVCAATADTQNGNNGKVALSHKANDMIAQADNARKAVGGRNRDAAIRDVNEALADARKMETAKPNEKVVPIYSEIERISIIGPVRAAKSRANANATSGTAERSANPTNARQCAK